MRIRGHRQREYRHVDVYGGFDLMDWSIMVSVALYGRLLVCVGPLYVGVQVFR